MTDEPRTITVGPAERAVAIAMFVQTGEGPDGEAEFDALPDDERLSMLETAYEAMQAHVAWLTAAGFRIVPPGTSLVPQSEQEAAAMLLAVQQFRKAMDRNVSRKTALIGSPKLIVPPGTKLQ